MGDVDLVRYLRCDGTNECNRRLGTTLAQALRDEKFEPGEPAHIVPPDTPLESLDDHLGHRPV